MRFRGEKGKLTKGCLLRMFDFEPIFCPECGRLMIGIKGQKKCWECFCKSLKNEKFQVII